METYENLHDNHMRYHSIKQWLLDGCDREDANTIREAVKRVPERRIKRRLARALLQDDDC
jgi:hypothetical protein